jgi:hypothetical protein
LHQPNSAIEYVSTGRRLASWCRTDWCKGCLDGIRADAAVDEALGLLGQLVEGSQQKVEVAVQKGNGRGGSEGPGG